MKKSNIIIIICALLIIVLCACSTQKSAKTKIDFPKSADLDIKAESISADVKALQDTINSLIEEAPVFVFENPVKSDFSIAEDFGFDINTYSVFSENDKGAETRLYSRDNNKVFLKIDNYGCFTYKTGIDETSFDIALSKEECCNIAKTFLKKNNLLPSGVGNNWSANEWSLSDENSRVVNQYGINLFKDKVDGREIIGNARITVEVNGNGEVVSVTKNWREYQTKKKTDLISVKEAVEMICSGDAYFIALDDDPLSIKIDGVSLAYYEQANNLDNDSIQPVYVFSGTAETSFGIKTISIVVQANK